MTDDSSKRKYTSIQVPNNSKAHDDLRKIARRLSKKMTTESGMTGQTVTIYQALEYCVAQERRRSTVDRTHWEQ